MMGRLKNNKLEGARNKEALTEFYISWYLLAGTERNHESPARAKI
jgi:hypothetical protein